MRIRLRLHVHRNDLPAVKTLWPIGATQCHHTIAQMLESVNQVFPLESDSWGLEHYTVSVGGFECLHWHQIGTVCKDEDEVIIRPLEYAEVRARTVLGRDQITSDGRHLFDGLPFGRPRLRQTVRPHLTIPPRKRRKFNDMPGGNEAAEERDAGLYLEWNGEPAAAHGPHVNGQLEPSSSAPLEDDDDSDFRESSADEDDAIGSTNRTSSSSSSDSNSMSSSEESSKNESSIPGRDSDSDSSLDSSSDDSSNESIQVDPNGRSGVKTNGSGLHEAHGGARSPPSRNGISKQPIRQCVVPGEGAPRTRERNRRRTASKRLKHLKATGQVPANASFADLLAWEDADNTSGGHTHTTNDQAEPDKQSSHIETAKANMERRRQRLLRAVASGGIDVTPGGYVLDKSPEAAERSDDSAERPEETSSRLASSNVLDERNVEQHEQGRVTDADQPVPVVNSVKAIAMVPSSVLRRSKLDLAGSRRMLFGSLGMRVPKTAQDQNDLQKKLAGRVGKNDQLNASAGVLLPAEKKATSTDEDLGKIDASVGNWRDKIILSAVECCEEGITLSEPPFPFYQRWDPQQRSKKQKKRKRASRSDEYEQDGHSFVESYDKYNQDGTGDALEYDDIGSSDDEYWEEGALQGDDDLDETLVQPEDFPAVPADYTSLPILAEKDARAGSFVVYEELTFSAATSWEPTKVTRTALLESKDDETSEWTILLAARDMPVREYDDEGNRVYRKFEMQGVDDDDDDDGRRRVVRWSELEDPRLLPHIE